MFNKNETDYNAIKTLLFLGLDVLGNPPGVFTESSSNIISNQTVDGQRLGRS
jgi:hypothetical protein